MSYGRTICFKGQYYFDNERLEKVDTLKDLGLTFDTYLKFREHTIVVLGISHLYSAILYFLLLPVTYF